MFLPECPFYVGIDWAAETHAVCVLDGIREDQPPSSRSTHTAAGFAELLAPAGPARPATRMQMPVAIERPDGRLVDALLRGRAPGGAGEPERDQDLARRARCSPAPSPTPGTPR